MERETIHNIKLGAFVIAGILFLIVALYLIGNNQNMFGQTFRLYATFHDVSGLQTGNNVRYAGINVGTVEKIEILNDTTIRVQMSVELRLKSNIKKNSPVSVGTDGLMGNKLINIDPGTALSPSVNENDELAGSYSVNTEEMLRTLELSNYNIAVISENLKEITDNLNKGRGTLYTVLTDTTLAKKLSKTISNIEAVSNNLADLTNDFATITSDVKSGKGLLGTLIKDTVVSLQLQQAINEVRQATGKINESGDEMKQTLRQINNGNGIISTLLTDSATAVHFKKSLAHIDSSAMKFSENMEALRNNIFFRGYFKKQKNSVKIK